MTGLVRTMRLWDVVWFFVAAIVGLRWIALAAAAGPSALLVWLGALVCFYLPLAFTVIKLSERYPAEGGLYVWTKQAFGDFPGFVAGWMYWMSNLVYFPGLLYFGAGSALFIGDPSGRALSGNATFYVLASLGGLGVALFLNVVGLRVGKWLHNVGGFGTWIPIALLIVMAVIAVGRFGPATAITAADLVPSVSIKSMIFWSTIAFGFGGFETAPLMCEEIHDPSRTIPRAVIVAGLMIAAIYVLGTAAVIATVPRGDLSGLQGIMQAIRSAAERTGWPAVEPVAAVLITVGTLGGVSAWLASTSRLPFVAGVDRVLPPAFARLHPRWGTPWVALCVQAAGAALFVWLGQAGSSVEGAYDVLVSLGVISYFIPFVLMFAAMIKLDGRASARAIAGLGLLVTVGSIGLAAIPPPESDPVVSSVKVIGGSVALLILGALLYARGRRRIATGRRRE